MLNEPVISCAVIEDVPLLVHLVNSAYRGEYSKQGWTTEADLLDGIRTDEESVKNIIAMPGSVILKYGNDDGDIFGCVYLKKQNDRLYLGMLTVAPELQDNGIGKQLLEAAEAYARHQGCSAIVMTVISIRHELIAWYERRGYKRTGETQPFPSDIRFGIPKQPLEFVVMEKSF